MPKANQRLTDTVVKALPIPQALPGKRKQVFYQCPKTPGFGVRVTDSGDKAFVLEREVEGKTVRRTLGKASGRGAISTEAARKLMVTTSSAIQMGDDPLETKRAKRVEAKKDSTTLADALAQYVKGKRRGKDGLALKERTKADYLAMVAPGGKAKSGKPFADGALFPLADKSIHRITAADMRKVYDQQLTHSQRRSIYAMQVLRAVLNWHWVTVADSPLAKGTAGKNRIVLAPTQGDPRPIPPEKLGAWRQAAEAMDGHPGADGLRFMLLTGCRPGEVFGDGFEPGLLVSMVDMAGGRITLPDTKNRKDHTVLMSAQVCALVAAHIDGKKPNQKVFDIGDPRKALMAICEVAEVVGVTPHKLRHTFASVAAELVSGFALKRMLNHTEAGDVTGAHYVSTGDTQLRAAWQTVADFITATE